MINMLLETTTMLTGAIIIAIMTLALTIIFAINSFRMKQRRDYSFLNEFPFELTQGVGANFTRFMHVLVLFFSIMMIFFGFYRIEYIIAHFSGLVFLMSWTLTAFLIYLIFIVKFTSVKRHLFISALFFLLTVLNGLMFGLYLQLSPVYMLDKTYPIISYILGAIALLLVLNPKLSHWSYMDKIEQQDGTVIVLRPRVFVLAFTEWALVLINILIMINAYFSSFVA